MLKINQYQKQNFTNYIWNLLVIIINSLIPLIITPYLIRTIGPEKLGLTYAANSIIFWFTIFTLFGALSYGTREISKNTGNISSVGKIFYSILFLNLILSIFSVVLFIIFFLSSNIIFTESYYISLISLLYLFSNIFYSDWYFYGIGNFSSFAKKTVFVRIASLVFVFIFIQNPNDTLTYYFFTTILYFFGSILVLTSITQKLKMNFRTILNDLPNHFKKMTIFFLISLIISIYTSLDQFILASFNFYVDLTTLIISKTILNIITSIITIIININLHLVPNLIFTKADKKLIGEKILQIKNFLFFLTFPLIFGLVFFSLDLTKFFFNDINLQYNNIIFTLMFLSLPLVVYSTYLEKLLIIPYNLERKSLTLLSIISFIYILLIPFLYFYGALGAVILRFLIEIIILGLRLKLINAAKLPNPIHIHSFFTFVLSSLIMYIILRFLNGALTFSNLYIKFVFFTFSGFLIYMIFLLILNNSFVIGKFKIIYSRIFLNNK